MKESLGQPEKELALLSNEKSREQAEDEIDAEVAFAALASIECDPSQIVRGEELDEELREIVG